MNENIIYSSQLGLVLSLYEDYAKAKAIWESDYKKYKDYIAYAEEINRQMNEKFSQNDTYNGNILKNKLMYEIYPEQDRLGRVQTESKKVMDAALVKYNDAKSKLSAAEQQTAANAANAAAQASIALSASQIATAQENIDKSSARMSEEERKALIKKIIVYSIAGLALLTVIGLSVWAYRKYIRK